MNNIAPEINRNEAFPAQARSLFLEALNTYRVAKYQHLEHRVFMQREGTTETAEADAERASELLLCVDQTAHTLATLALIVSCAGGFDGFAEVDQS